MQMREKNYKIAEIGHTGQRQLVLKGDWQSEMADIMRAENIRALTVSGYAGWNGSDLDFLRDIPFLERLSLIVLNRVKIEGIYFLPELKDLSVGYNKKRIDFTRFPHLERLSLGWCSGYESLFECQSLRDIAISRLPDHQMASLSRLPNLENLALSSYQSTDLRSLPHLHQLLRLSLITCNRLRYLTGLERCPNVLVVWIEQAKSLGDISAITALEVLRTLVLRDCPQIESIKPISDLQNLEAVALDATTRILDGDLSPLVSLPRLRNAGFKNRPHYSNRSEEFPKDLPIFL
jgi:hypothetical protein